MAITYNKKLIISGRKAELYYYEESIKVKKPRKKTKTKRRTRDEMLVELIKSNKAEFELEVFRDSSLKRTRENITRLIDSNPDLNVFITLTFEENISDLREANLFFRKFIKRLKRVIPDLKYLAVPEFQKRGAVHYHVLVNFEMENKRLADIWGNGFVMINKVKHVKRIGSYVAKYISKDLFDLRYYGMRKILPSQNLKRPIVITSRSEIKKFFQENKDNKKIIKEGVYFSDWLGRIDYRLYEF